MKPMPHSDTGKVMDTIELPILILSNDYIRYKRFVRDTGFEPHVVKMIRDIESIHGYKDKTLLVIERVPTISEVVMYAKSHNIKVVYHGQ